METTNRTKNNKYVAFTDTKEEIGGTRERRDRQTTVEHQSNGDTKRKRKDSDTKKPDNLMQQNVPPSQSNTQSNTQSSVPPSISSSVNRTPPPSSASTKESNQVEKLQQLKFLKDLFDQGFITVVEYKERKSQLIDVLTGTTTATKGTLNSRSQTPRHAPQIPTVIATPPPDWALFKEEKAVKHVFDPITQEWSTSVVKVKMDTKPFACGGLRKCYHLQDLTVPNERFVAKLSIDPYEDREVYFVDVEIQMYSKQFAKKFNEPNPPKKVDFVSAWLLELIDREERPFCGVEIFIDGPYRKHNNNFGYVSEDERNTPQAFSHFTYEASNHTILICDIQGVGDCYTDPQMHTIEIEDEKGEIRNFFRGKGNMGAMGIGKFLATHQCNAICRYLRLPSINAKLIDAGTIPAQTYMSYSKVDVVNLVLPPNYSSSHSNLNFSSSAAPLLPKPGDEYQVEHYTTTTTQKSNRSCCVIL